LSTQSRLARACLALAFFMPVTAAQAGPADPGGMAYSSSKQTREAPAGSKARVLRSGLAIAPADAPPVVKRIIAAGNRIAHKPYVYGGGHGSWKSSGYDCSGSVSFALHGGNLLKSPLPSYGFYKWGQPGPGKWVTIYTHGGHMYMVVAGLRFDTSGLSADGTRWHKDMRSPAGYTVRHPGGL
jgi:cell wall-associated NlpC family hydrolase